MSDNSSKIIILPKEIDDSIAIRWKNIIINQQKTNPSVFLINPVRNTCWEYLKFLNSSVFSSSAREFTASKELCKGTNRKPSYTSALEGTSQYKEYWNLQRKRCLEGYTVGGIRITGEHYFYLNFTLILRTTKDPNTGEEIKRLGFPDFCDMDYYYYLELEKNENPEKYDLPSTSKKGMIIAKARRKGWSFKGAAGCVWKYTFFRESYNIIGAFLESYALSTMNMCKEMCNFLDEYTEFRHPRIYTRQDELLSGYEENIDGIKVKKGYKSTIKTITFKDAAYKSVGRSATRFLFEEAGLFQNLKIAYTASEPLFRDGNRMIGIAQIFGTGGDMDGSTQDFADMFYNPRGYGLAEYDNIWDDNVSGTCGWFVDEMWYRPGKISYLGEIVEGVDENGNANREAAELDLDRERLIKKTTDRKAYTLLITQKCKTPAEAFLVSEGTVFPVAELYNRLSILKSDNLYKDIGTKITLIDVGDNQIDYTVDLDNKLHALHTYPLNSDEDPTGCIVQYEPPIEIEGKVPNDMYIIGHDPYGIDSEGGKSLGAAFVLKTARYMKYGYMEIVAEYVGRPEQMKTYNYNLEKLSLYYGGAKIMFENDRGEVKNWFERRRKLHLLAEQPDSVLSKAIPGTKLNRIYGCSMSSERMKAEAEKYIYDWLIEERGTGGDGKIVKNLDLIPSVGLLEELIRYNRKNNFDRCLAFAQVVIFLEEKYLLYVNPAPSQKTSSLDFLINNKSLFPKYQVSPILNKI